MHRAHCATISMAGSRMAVARAIASALLVRREKLTVASIVDKVIYFCSTTKVAACWFSVCSCCRGMKKEHFRSPWVRSFHLAAAHRCFTPLSYCAVRRCCHRRRDRHSSCHHSSDRLSRWRLLVRQRLFGRSRPVARGDRRR